MSRGHTLPKTKRMSNVLRVKNVNTYLNLLSFIICVSKFKGLNIRVGENKEAANKILLVQEG